MKKLLACVLSLTMVLSFTACSSSSGSSTTTAAPVSSAAATEAAETTEAAQEADSDAINGPEDLAGKKIGVQEGTTGDIYVSGDFEEDYPDTVLRYKTGYEAVQALLTDKVNCVVIDDQVAQSFVEANEGLKILETAYTDEEYALYINSDQEELLEQVNAAIAELQENGVLDDIIAYYIDEDETASAYQAQTSESFPNGTLDIAVNPYFPPYEYYEGEEIWGIDADMCRAIGDILGMEVTFSAMDFTASLTAVQTGKNLMAMGGITVTEDRAAAGLFSITYYNGKQVIIVKE
ncbi:MAG: transporter substrate-binding domain-containing protein [Clostridiales bacterium]|nr:transporter substrate-binding domain-containing protein [Clostridiales bacterium]